MERRAMEDHRSPRRVDRIGVCLCNRYVRDASAAIAFRRHIRKEKRKTSSGSLFRLRLLQARSVLPSMANVSALFLALALPGFAAKTDALSGEAPNNVGFCRFGTISLQARSVLPYMANVCTVSCSRPPWLRCETDAPSGRGPTLQADIVVSVFDWEDVDKKLKRLSSPDSLRVAATSGVGEAPVVRNKNTTVSPAPRTARVYLQ